MVIRAGYSFGNTREGNSDGSAGGMVGIKEGTNVENSMGFDKDDSRADGNWSMGGIEVYYVLESSVVDAHNN